MRIIFSRKGFDSEAGGVPSPIVDGKPISLPIPTTMPTPTRYGDLRGPHAALVSDLTRRRKKVLTEHHPCHLDPDIDSDVLPRMPGWRGAFGQTDSAQSHLARQGVTSGDLFLFWGLFRAVERSGGVWRYVGKPEHRVFGWLQIDTVLPLGPNGAAALQEHPWLRDHPHARDGWTSGNTIYVARERLDIPGCNLSHAGWGLLPLGHTLTAPDCTPSIWRAPAWLNPRRGGVGMTFHKPDSWLDGGRVQTVGRGQEFVAQVDPANVSAWLSELFSEAGR